MLRYRPKPKPARIRSDLLLLYLGRSPTLALPFTGSPVAPRRAAPSQNTHRHTPTLRARPQTTGFKEERRLSSARRRTPRRVTPSDKTTYRAATAQSTEPPRKPRKNRVRQHGPWHEDTVKRDGACARSPASRPKNIRMQGRAPTLHENGPLETRAADTAWNDAAKENRPETSTPRDRSTLYACKARREAPTWHYADEQGHSRLRGGARCAQRAVRMLRYRYGLRHGRQMTKMAQHHRHSLERSCPIGPKRNPFLLFPRPKGPAPAQPSPLR